MARLALPVHSYTLRSAPASPARLVNCYPESLPADAKTPMVLSRAPGVHEAIEFGNGPIRGLYSANGLLYVVSNTDLYSMPIDQSTTTPLGTIPGTGPVSIAHNASGIVIVAEPDAYFSDGLTLASLTQITDVDFTARGAKYVKFLDNYLLFLEPDSGRFFGADLGSATSFDALDFATAEASPDDLVGMEVDHRQLILFGTDSVEVWENTGAAGFPFERAINGVVEIGCFNGDTVARLDNSVFWFANDYTIRRLDGLTPKRVSTHAVEQFLSTVDVSTGRAYSYSQDGHFFYVLCFTTGCWVYDATTGEWHERSTYPHEYFRWQYHAQVNGRQYVGDYYSSQTGYFDPETYTDGDGVQRMEFTFQPVYAENRRAFHKRLELVMEVGVGITTGQGDDPEIMLSYSDDGGQTWTNAPNKKLGPIGQYDVRVVWTGLGSARQRVYRCAITDPVKVVISDAVLEVEGGRL